MLARTVDDLREVLWTDAGIQKLNSSSSSSALEDEKYRTKISRIQNRSTSSRSPLGSIVFANGHICKNDLHSRRRCWYSRHTSRRSGASSRTFLGIVVHQAVIGGLYLSARVSSSGLPRRADSRMAANRRGRDGGSGNRRCVHAFAFIFVNYNQLVSFVCSIIISFQIVQQLTRFLLSCCMLRVIVLCACF